MMINRKIIAICALIVSMAVSCTKTPEVDGGGEAISDKMISICPNFTVRSVQSATRAGDVIDPDSDSEDPYAEIHNLWVISLDADGEVRSATYISNYSREDVIEVNSKIREIKFVANSFDEDAYTQGGAPTEDTKPMYSTDSDGNQHVVLYGEYERTSDKSSDYDILYADIELKRNITRVNFEINSRYTIQSARIINIPKKIDYYPETLDTPDDLYNLDLTAEQIELAQGDGLELYLPSNMRGEVDNGYDPKQKTAHAPDGATAIELTLEMGETLETETNRVAICTIYLGANANDYNLTPNYSYTNKINIIEFDETDDTRVVEVHDYTTSDYGSSNCYMVHPSGYDQILYIPIEARINEFYTNTSYNSGGISPIAKNEEWNARIIWKYYSDTQESTNDGGSNPVKSQLVTLERVTSGFNSKENDNAYGDKENSALKITIPSNIEPGNIMFAVGSGNDSSYDIYWSWHLWITDYDPDAIAAANINNIVASTAKSYTLAGKSGAVHRYVSSDQSDGNADRNYCWDEDKMYGDKFIMDRYLGAYTNVWNYCYRGSNLYYEFGRKDPFPALEVGGDPTPFYADPYSGHSSSSGTSTFLNSVKNPLVYYYNSTGNWTTESVVDNVWNDITLGKNDNLTISKKSIFDPCPLGWCVAVNGTWSGFSTSNCTLVAADEYGYKIHYPLDGDDYAEYGMSGRIMHDVGSVAGSGYNGEGLVWSSTYSSEVTSNSLSFSRADTAIGTVENGYTAYVSTGMAVRPVQQSKISEY